MALDTDPESIDWVARNTTGVIDFRLADDPWRVPDEVYNVRMAAYMRQVLPLQSALSRMVAETKTG